MIAARTFRGALFSAIGGYHGCLSLHAIFSPFDGRLGLLDAEMLALGM